MRIMRTIRIVTPRIHPPADPPTSAGAGLALTLFLLLLLAAFPSADAQTTFSEVTPVGDPYFDTPPEDDFWVNAVAPADVDADGDLDLAVLGYYVVYNQSAEDRLVLLLNQGPGEDGRWVFSHQLVPLGNLFAGSSDLAWADFDGDGDDDLAVGSEGATALFRNDGGTLTLLTDELPGYLEDSLYTGAYDLRSITWADVDNDGDPDLLLPSVFDPMTSEFQTKLMRNDGPDGAGGWLFGDSLASLDPTVHAQSSWADDDGDADLDLFMVNVDPYYETGFVRRYANQPEGFVAQDLLGIQVEHGLADQGDYDADGDLDILVAGNILDTDGTYQTVLRVYDRQDDGTYLPIELGQLTSVFFLDYNAATWADYDSDGDMDLLITGDFVGQTDIEGRSEVLVNEGGVFSALALELPAPISSSGHGGAFSWLDLDADGDLDYLVAGAYFVAGGAGLVEASMHLYRNDPAGSNAAPAPPTALVANVVGDAVTLSWSPASDDNTPSGALTYDLELRASGVAPPSARRLPEPGNLGAVSEWALRGLAPGSYTWTVRAVDAAMVGGPWASGTFMVRGEVIFADGFESGGLGAWSSVMP